jgi:hypothetical protein
MALRHIKTKRSLKDENKHLHSLVKHLQIELENQGLTSALKRTQSTATARRTSSSDSALTVCMHMMFSERKCSR